MQYNTHWIFTLIFPRNVKRSNLFTDLIFAKTGSAIPIRWSGGRR